MGFFQNFHLSVDEKLLCCLYVSHKNVEWKLG